MKSKTHFQIVAFSSPNMSRRCRNPGQKKHRGQRRRGASCPGAQPAAHALLPRGLRGSALHHHRERTNPKSRSDSSRGFRSNTCFHGSRAVEIDVVCSGRVHPQRAAPCVDVIRRATYSFSSCEGGSRKTQLNRCAATHVLPSAPRDLEE